MTLYLYKVSWFKNEKYKPSLVRTSNVEANTEEEAKSLVYKINGSPKEITIVSIEKLND